MGELSAPVELLLEKQGSLGRVLALSGRSVGRISYLVNTNLLPSFHTTQAFLFFPGASLVMQARHCDRVCPGVGEALTDRVEVRRYSEHSAWIVLDRAGQRSVGLRWVASMLRNLP